MITITVDDKRFILYRDVGLKSDLTISPSEVNQDMDEDNDPLTELVRMSEEAGQYD